MTSDHIIKTNIILDEDGNVDLSVGKQELIKALEDEPPYNVSEIDSLLSMLNTVYGNGSLNLQAYVNSVLDQVDTHTPIMPKPVDVVCGTIKDRGSFVQPRYTPEQIEGIHQEALDKTGFWGTAGAGCIFVSKKTKRIGIGLRGLEVLQPMTWGTIGGAVDPGEEPRATVRRELHEELGYTLSKGESEDNAKVKLHYVYKNPAGTFQYSTFVVFVDDEFEGIPSNHETAMFKWFTLEDLRIMDPKDIHFGLWPIIRGKDEGSLEDLVK